LTDESRESGMDGMRTVVRTIYLRVDGTTPTKNKLKDMTTTRILASSNYKCINNQ